MNEILYYYNINKNKVNYIDKEIFFYEDKYYQLLEVDNNFNIEFYEKINYLNKNCFNKILINKYNEFISKYNDKYFILTIVNGYYDKDLFLSNIIDMQNKNRYEYKIIDYGSLWEKKIDYLEDMIYENGKKYPLIVDSFNYYVGLAENAIQYFNMIDIRKINFYTISHKYIDNNLNCLYIPNNIIIDYRVRDISEYIKLCFFRDMEYNDLIKELDLVINNNFSYEEISLLIARLLYPSYYFKYYDLILLEGEKEDILNNIISSIDEYEYFLERIIDYFNRKFNIIIVDWLKEKSY